MNRLVIHPRDPVTGECDWSRWGEITFGNRAFEFGASDDSLKEILIGSVDRFFIAGAGFPRFVREGPVLARDANGKVRLSGYATLASEPEDVISAVEENFLIAGGLYTVFRPGRFQLRVVSGREAGKLFPLLSETVHIGRAPACEVVLTDPVIARRHFRLRWTAGAAFVYEDLRPVNQVRINDAPCDPQVLYPLVLGDVLSVGDVKLVLQLSGDSSWSRPDAIPLEKQEAETAFSPPQPRVREEILSHPAVAELLQAKKWVRVETLTGFVLATANADPPLIRVDVEDTRTRLYVAYSRDKDRVREQYRIVSRNGAFAFESEDGVFSTAEIAARITGHALELVASQKWPNRGEQFNAPDFQLTTHDGRREALRDVPVQIYSWGAMDFDRWSAPRCGNGQHRWSYPDIPEAPAEIIWDSRLAAHRLYAWSDEVALNRALLQKAESRLLEDDDHITVERVSYIYRRQPETITR